MPLTYIPAPGTTFNWTVGTPVNQTIIGTITAPPANSFTTTFAIAGLTLTQIPPPFPTNNPSFLISGIPTVSSFGNVFSISVFDAFGVIIENAKSYVANIFPFVCPTITIDPPTLPDGSVGVPYNQIGSASGGTAPYVYGLIGLLPDGLLFVDNGDGTFSVSGTPTTSGTFDFTITVTDDNDCPGEQFYTITITAPAPTPTTRRRKRRIVGALPTIYCDPQNFKDGICPPILTYNGNQYLSVGNGNYTLRRG